MSDRYGKPLNIPLFKNTNIKDFKKTCVDNKKNIYKQYWNGMMRKCPLCGNYTYDNKIAYTQEIYYLHCKTCSLWYTQLTHVSDDLLAYYKKNEAYQKTYADKETTAFRIKEVHAPRVSWLINNYVASFGRKPKKILDIGCGSGHFVKACLNEGIRCDGIEISESGTKFAKEHLGINIFNLDFLEHHKEFSDYDIITFWGVLEHVNEPNLFVSLATECLSNDGMLAIGVPVFESITTKIQLLTGANNRHLHPIKHSMLFNEDSLSYLCKKHSLMITDKWFFGMDAFELMMQLSVACNKQGLIDSAKPLLNDLQLCFDKNKLSDNILICARRK